MTDVAEEGRDAQYRAQLGQALRAGDVQALREFLISQAQTYGDEEQVQAIVAQTDQELTSLMHRMILARPDLADKHAASRTALGMDSAPGGGARRRPRRPR